MSRNYKLKFYYMKFIYLVSNSCMDSHAYIVRMSLCYKLTCTLEIDTSPNNI